MHLARFEQLVGKVDTFFTRVQARHAADMRCGAGCAACCQAGLTVTGVEAAALRAHLATLPAGRRAALAARAAAPAPTACPALDEAGRCGVYAARPLVCRSHGVPIRLRGEGGLPVVQACELNFTAAGPAAAAPDCVLDQTTMSTLLAAVDAEHAQATGGHAGVRVPLASLLVEAAP